MNDTVIHNDCDVSVASHPRKAGGSTVIGELSIRIPNTTACATVALSEIKPGSVYVPKAQLDEALYHLQVMVILNKQLQQRVDELEAQ